MLVAYVVISLSCLGLAIAFLVGPSLFPGPSTGRIPVVVALLLLAGLNFLRFTRARQLQRGDQIKDQVPKKPLGL